MLLDGDMKERRAPVLGNNLAVVDVIGFNLSGFSVKYMICMSLMNFWNYVKHYHEMRCEIEVFFGWIRV